MEMDCGVAGRRRVGCRHGATRDLVYSDRVGELAAHQLSTATLLALLAFYIWLIDQRWPIPTTRTALAIGAVWVTLTVLFEFGLGRYALGSSWPDLLANYNLTDGRVWVLVPLWMALGPAAMNRLRTTRR